MNLTGKDQILHPKKVIGKNLRKINHCSKCASHSFNDSECRRMSLSCSKKAFSIIKRNNV